MRAASDRRLVAGWAAAMLAFWAATAVESMSWNQLSAFTPIFLHTLGVHSQQVPGWTALMASLSWVIGIPLAPFWGVWADRYSRKAVIVRSALVEALVFTGWALSTSPAMALAFRCLSGFVLGNTGVMLAVQASVTPVERLGIAVGIVSAGGPTGRAAGPALGALLIHVFSVRGMLLADAALSVGTAILLTVLVTEPERVRPVGVSAFRLLSGAFGEIVSTPLVWRLFVATMAAQLGFWIVGPFLPIYVQDLVSPARAAGAATAVGAVLSSVALAGAVGSPLWGRAVDRFGHVPVLTCTSVAAAAALVAAGLAGGALAGLAAPLVAYGFFSAAMTTSIMALLARTVSAERRGAVLGQVLFPFYVAGLLGPLVGGAIFPHGRTAVMAAAAAATLVPLALLLSARRPALPPALP
ncbi:MAG: MFS transporter [Candidatus Dormibacterales bacterium]